MKRLNMILACLLLGGCAAIRNTKKVTPLDSGREVAMTVGQTLVVELPGNQTTGYDWRDESTGEAVLQLKGEPAFLRDSSPYGLVGVGGTELWSYRAVKTGNQTLHLEYARAWETNAPPASVVTFNVVVSEKSK